MSLTGHELVEKIFPLASPKNDQVAAELDYLRSEFTSLGHTIVSATAVTPEQTLAIRKLHEALQASITAVVLHQEMYR